MSNADLPPEAEAEAGLRRLTGREAWRHASREERATYVILAISAWLILASLVAPIVVAINVLWTAGEVAHVAHVVVGVVAVVVLAVWAHRQLEFDRPPSALRSSARPTA